MITVPVLRSFLVIEGRHFVFAIDEVNHEHVRGFSGEIDLEGPLNDVFLRFRSDY